MDPTESQSGLLITFYSYKGGTGRSMAVANTACLLARLSPKKKTGILAIDWDLDAPGLHRFFATHDPKAADDSDPGLIDYFTEMVRLFHHHPEVYDQICHIPDGANVLEEHLPLRRFIVPDVAPGVDLMKAGRFDILYAEHVRAFDWVGFFGHYQQALIAFRGLLASRYAYCLIDSRTGLTDTSSICTALLPEKLVAVFTPNNQSLYGLLSVTAQAVAYRQSSEDMRPLAIFPLPSRLDFDADRSLRLRWRKEYQAAFEKDFKEIYGVQECDLTAYLDEVLLPHIGDYSYGETIAVLEERGEAFSLSRAFQIFARRLVGLGFAWESLKRIEPSFPAREKQADMPSVEAGTDNRGALDIQVNALVQQATDAFRQRNFDLAAILTRQILEMEPFHNMALDLLRRLDLAQNRAVLTGSSGQRYTINKDSVLVGRPSISDNTMPEIDLSQESLGNTVSRQHARITRVGKQWFLEALPTMNVTRVGAEELRPGIRKPLSDGDTVQFGGVKLTFQMEDRAKSQKS